MARGVQTRMFVAPTVARRGEFGPGGNATHPHPHPSPIPSRKSPSQTRGQQETTLTREPFAADFVQELYLKELKAYKTPAVKPTDAEGQVHAFNPPKTPASPEEADLASSLKEYESMAVDVEGSDAAAANTTGGQAAARDWLEEEEEA